MLFPLVLEGREGQVGSDKTPKSSRKQTRRLTLTTTFQAVRSARRYFWHQFAAWPRFRQTPSPCECILLRVPHRSIHPDCPSIKSSSDGSPKGPSTSTAACGLTLFGYFCGFDLRSHEGRVQPSKLTPASVGLGVSRRRCVNLVYEVGAP